MKQKTILIMLLSALVVAGCDSIYGLTRTAQVLQVPDPARVKKAIASVPGVEKVKYSYSEGGRPLTLNGIQAPDKVYTFTYSGGTNVHGDLQFEMDYSSNMVFRQTLLRMNQRPPQEWIDATRPIMKQIEIRLEQECGLTGLSTSVVERCHGVKAN